MRCDVTYRTFQAPHYIGVGAHYQGFLVRVPRIFVQQGTVITHFMADDA